MSYNGIGAGKKGPIDAFCALWATDKIVNIRQGSLLDPYGSNNALFTKLYTVQKRKHVRLVPHMQRESILYVTETIKCCFIFGVFLVRYLRLLRWNT
jgi:hypothetical protein